MGPRDAVTMARIDAAQQQYQVQKDKYERLRSDVTIKLKFLEENKVFYSVTLITKSLCDILNTHVISHCISHCFFLAGESNAQAASPFPQCHLCLLRWEPAAVGTDPQAVQHKAQTPRSRQTVLARGAVKVAIALPWPRPSFSYDQFITQTERPPAPVMQSSLYSSGQARC